jgi:RNA polymerase sigma factor (TIGR02999 family)
MSDVTRILSAVEQGDAHAAEQLLPLVYAELRKLAAQKLTQEKPGQTLDATALVHEAYLRLVGPEEARGWNGKGHFFAAAAEAMRRILVENARRKKRVKHGGTRQRVEIEDAAREVEEPPDDFLDMHQALCALEQADAVAAQVVKLRYFTGLTLPQTAEAMGLSLRTAERNWTFARTWLHRALNQAGPDDDSVS